MGACPSWAYPDSPPALGPGEVHVWRLDLDTRGDQLPTLELLLQADETARAERFRFPEHRTRFIVCRASLRLLLARYLVVPAVRVSFTYTAHGKPELADSHHSDLRFNVSHAGGWALIALTRGRSVGVDIEWMRPDVDCMEIAAQYFSAAERAALECLPHTERTRAFYACWVRKEAAIKAWGMGLSLPLDSFCLMPGVETTCLTPPPGMTNLARLEVNTLKLHQGYAAAVAMEGEAYTLHCWEAGSKL